jgi:hypothetical protein
MKLFRDENGQAMVLTAFCVATLLGFMALAIDVGVLFRAKRNLQIAADSAALAAALDYLYNHNPNDTTVNNTNVSNSVSVGVAAAALDGVPATGGTTVDVHCPVKYGPYASGTCNGYFEALISQPNTTGFMAMSGLSSVAVAVRAVAGTPYQATGCFYTQSATGTLGNGKNADSTAYFQGSFALNAPKCGMVVNGTSPDTLSFTGNGGSLSVGAVSVVGGCSGPACTTGKDSTTTAVTGIAPVTSPFQSIVPPTPSGCSAPSGGTLTGTSVQPGCYSGNVTISNATLAAGTYIFTGNVTIGGTVNATSGVVMDFTTGSFNENSNSTFNITAPTSGLYMGIAFLAPISNTSNIQLEFGNATTNFTGIVDMPGVNLTLHDSGAKCDTITADLVVGTFNDQTGCLDVDSYSQIHNSPLKAVALVE